MDWSTDLLKNLYSNRLNQNMYKNGEIVDVNGDGKSDYKDLNKLKSEEKNLFANAKLYDVNDDDKFDYNDLISLSTMSKDHDDDGEITEEENNFFGFLKDKIYEKLAQNIDRDKDLSLDDMLELEKTARALDSDEDLTDEQKETIKEDLNKVQNRMISNLNAQFFVTEESALYKANAKANAKAVYEAEIALGELNESEYNPFNNKFENLLDKLEKRNDRTLAETMTLEQIAEFKAKVIKGIKEDEPIIADDETIVSGELDENGYGWLKVKSGELFFYHDDEVFSGVYEKRFYDAGKLATGFDEGTQKFYIAGNLALGAWDGRTYYHGVEIIGDATEQIKDFINKVDLKYVQITDDGFNCKENINGQFVEVEYVCDITKDITSFVKTIKFDEIVSQVDTVDAGKLQTSQITLKGESENVIFDAPVDNTADYFASNPSVYVKVADDENKNVEIGEVYTNRITHVQSFEQQEGNFELVKEQVALASLLKVKDGESLKTFTLSDKLTCETIVEEGVIKGIKITDNETDGLEVVKYYNADGELVSGSLEDERLPQIKVSMDFGSNGAAISGLVTIADTEIPLNEGDEVTVHPATEEVVIYSAETSKLSTYSIDGEEVRVLTATAATTEQIQTLATAIGWSVADITNANVEGGKVTSFTSNGITYNVTYNNDVTTLISSDNKIEKRYKNKVEIYNKSPQTNAANSNFVIVEKNTSNVLIAQTITANDGKLISKTEYNATTGRMEKETTVNGVYTTAKEYSYNESAKRLVQRKSTLTKVNSSDPSKKEEVQITVFDETGHKIQETNEKYVNGSMNEKTVNRYSDSKLASVTKYDSQDRTTSIEKYNAIGAKTETTSYLYTFNPSDAGYNANEAKRVTVTDNINNRVVSITKYNSADSQIYKEEWIYLPNADKGYDRTKTVTENGTKTIYKYNGTTLVSDPSSSTPSSADAKNITLGINESQAVTVGNETFMVKNRSLAESNLSIFVEGDTVFVIGGTNLELSSNSTITKNIIYTASVSKNPSGNFANAKALSTYNKTIDGVAYTYEYVSSQNKEYTLNANAGKILFVNTKDGILQYKIASNAASQTVKVFADEDSVTMFTQSAGITVTEPYSDSRSKVAFNTISVTSNKMTMSATEKTINLPSNATVSYADGKITVNAPATDSMAAINLVFAAKPTIINKYDEEDPDKIVSSTKFEAGELISGRLTNGTNNVTEITPKSEIVSFEGNCLTYKDATTQTIKVINKNLNDENINSKLTGLSETDLPKLFDTINMYNSLKAAGAESLVLSSIKSATVKENAISIKTDNKEYSISLEVKAGKIEKIATYSVTETKGTNVSITSTYKNVVGSSSLKSRSLNLTSNGKTTSTPITDSATCTIQSTTPVTVKVTDNITTPSAYSTEAIYLMNGTAQSSKITIGSKTVNIPSGSTVKAEASKITVTKESNDYSIKLVFDTAGTLKTAESFIQFGNNKRAITDFDNIYVNSNEIELIKGGQKTVYNIKSGNVTTRDILKGDLSINDFFNKLGLSSSSLIKESLLTFYNTTTNAEIKGILYFFVNLDSEGTAISVNGKFTKIAGTGGLTKDNLGTAFGTTDGNTKITKAMLEALPNS